MQLVAYGAQDVYLTGNPQITFFKVVYRRHTNFSMESIEQTFNGTVGFGKKVTCTISRNGDLVNQIVLQAVLQADVAGATNNWVADAGNRLVETCSVEIGGQQIDKHYALWLHIWTELTVPEGKRSGLSEMLGGVGVQTDATAARTIYVPLRFWFCRNPGLALPLIALQYHEVKINIEFASRADCSVTFDPVDATAADTASTMTSADVTASLWVDYIYLDTEERRRFAQVSHEYLIEQVQHTGAEPAAGGGHRLNFNHPCKELIWVTQAPVAVASSWDSFTANSNSKLQLNGHDRMASRPGDYFSLVQPYQFHTRVPVSTDGSLNINVYSFALKPEDHQPSGTCNFSRIDNATLTTNYVLGGLPTDANLYVFAVNYNVLRIMGGMGGLAYSN